VVPEAIADARKNAKLNGINNATFVQGDLNKINESFGKEFPKPDIIISGSYWSIQRCCSWALKFNYAICSEIKI
jgi:tRNA G37 N-methylase Trm5